MVNWGRNKVMHSPDKAAHDTGRPIEAAMLASRLLLEQTSRNTSFRARKKKKKRSRDIANAAQDEMHQMMGNDSAEQCHPKRPRRKEHAPVDADGGTLWKKPNQQSSPPAEQQLPTSATTLPDVSTLFATSAEVGRVREMVAARWPVQTPSDEIANEIRVSRIVASLSL